MLAPDAYAGWLDPAFREPLSLLDRPSDATIDAFQFHPVSMRVNGAALDDPACIAVASEPPRQESLF
jgi:putative SOS response-associated peptidase YedK